MWPCHFAGSDPAPTLPGYNKPCSKGAQRPEEEQSHPKTHVGCSHSHCHYQVQHLPGGNILVVNGKKNADREVVVVPNCSW